ncbi:MAG: peroxiredoxin family protein [Pyrinomonadaceae bacterium]
MKDLTNRIEVAANIAIIIVALLIGVVAVKRYLLVDQPARSNPQIVAGSKISLRNVDWTKSDQTLLLVLQKGCRFCSESAPFYRRLAQSVAQGRSNTQLIAVLPQDTTESRAYLNDLDVSIETKQATVNSLGASATPTLILVNRAGEVQASWVGKLPAEKELEVLRRVETERASN